MRHLVGVAALVAHASETIFSSQLLGVLHALQETFVSRFRIAVIGLGVTTGKQRLQFRQLRAVSPLLLHGLSATSDRRRIKEDPSLGIEHLHRLVVQLFRHHTKTLPHIPMGLLIELETHIVLEDRSVGRRHVGRQQLIHGLPDHMIEIQLDGQSCTHLQHTRQTAQEGLQERVDGTDMHIVVIQEHLPKTVPCPLRQELIRCTGVTQHEITRA